MAGIEPRFRWRIVEDRDPLDADNDKITAVREEIVADPGYTLTSSTQAYTLSTNTIPYSYTPYYGVVRLDDEPEPTENEYGEIAP